MFTSSKKSKRAVPRDIILALIVMILYLAALIGFVVTENDYFSIISAFISAISTVGFEIISKRKKKTISMTLSTMLLCVGIGFLVGVNYIEYFYYMDGFLNSKNIGNCLTVFSLLFVFISYVYDMIYQLEGSPKT